MIQAFEPRGGQATIGAGPRLVIYLNFSGLYPADKNEGAPPNEPQGIVFKTLLAFACYPAISKYLAADVILFLEGHIINNQFLIGPWFPVQAFADAINVHLLVAESPGGFFLDQFGSLSIDLLALVLIHDGPSFVNHGIKRRVRIMG